MDIRPAVPGAQMHRRNDRSWRNRPRQPRQRVVQVDDLVKTRPEQVLLARLASFLRPHRNPRTDSPHTQGITNRICKESTSHPAVPGKIEYRDPPNQIPASMT